MTDIEVIAILERSNLLLLDRINLLKSIGAEQIPGSAPYDGLNYCEEEYEAVNRAIDTIREKMERSKDFSVKSLAQYYDDYKIPEEKRKIGYNR